MIYKLTGAAISYPCRRQIDFSSVIPKGDDAACSSLLERWWCSNLASWLGSKLHASGYVCSEAILDVKDEAILVGTRSMS